MRKTLVVLLMAGLVTGTLVGSADAKKKKKKPKPPTPVAMDLTYYLRRDGEGCTEAAFRFLSLVDAPDFDASSCGNSNYGIPAMALGAEPIDFTTRDGDGAPLVLDATKEITGVIGVKSRSVSSGSTGVRFGVGTATLHVELLGEADGEMKTIAVGDFDYSVTPGTLEQIYEVEITLTPDAALDKATFTSLKITLENTGESTQHGFYTTDDPASHFKLGAWQ